MSKMRMDIFAYHIQSIALDTGHFKLHPCDGVVADVNITPTPMSESGSIWDNVTINGKSYGNRAGGIKAFVKMVGEVNPDISYN